MRKFYAEVCSENLIAKCTCPKCYNLAIYQHGIFFLIIYAYSMDHSLLVNVRITSLTWQQRVNMKVHENNQVVDYRTVGELCHFFCVLPLRNLLSNFRYRFTFPAVFCIIVNSASLSLHAHYPGADKSLARPTSRCFFYGENISFDDSFFIYTECHRRKGPNFGRVFLMLNYTDITQNTYIQS